jgi:hypothetical protein
MLVILQLERQRQEDYEFKPEIYNKMLSQNKTKQKQTNKKSNGIKEKKCSSLFVFFLDTCYEFNFHFELLCDYYKSEQNST